jgi:CheY-like chemotaxis protein
MQRAATKRPVVLVVEDEFLIRMHAAEMIEEGGFEVVEASNADEAVAILEARLEIAVCSPISKCRDPWTASSSP